MADEKILDISWKTIFKCAIAFFCFYLLYLTRDLLVWFVFALIISILFNPAIDFLQRKKVPRALAVIFIYFNVFVALSFLIYFTAPMFVIEIQQFSQDFPQYFEKISPALRGLGIQAFENLETFTATFHETLAIMSGNIFQAMFSIFGGIFSTFFVMIVAIFLSLEEKVVEKFLNLFTPKKYETYVLSLWVECQRKVSRWFLSRIIACLFVGVASYAAFSILNVEYPFSLGLFAGALNFIPYIGPLITALALFMIVGMDSIFKAFFILAVFGLIQLIENSFLTPLLMRKFLGLPPALLLLTLAVGSTLWGVWGAILCVPLAGILFEFIRDFLKKKKEDGTVVL
jgi:predicted PurR-regulated permease PerM